jgi:hypothetical protein
MSPVNITEVGYLISLKQKISKFEYKKDTMQINLITRDKWNMTYIQGQVRKRQCRNWKKLSTEP